MGRYIDPVHRALEKHNLNEYIYAKLVGHLVERMFQYSGPGPALEMLSNLGAEFNSQIQEHHRLVKEHAAMRGKKHG